MKIRIVTSDLSADMGLRADDFASFEEAEAAGYTQTGGVGGDHLRPELRGQPKLAGVYGPMWGGEEGGEPIIRYEAPTAYDRLSA